MNSSTVGQSRSILSIHVTTLAPLGPVDFPCDLQVPNLASEKRGKGFQAQTGLETSSQVAEACRGSLPEG